MTVESMEFVTGCAGGVRNWSGAEEGEEALGDLGGFHGVVAQGDVGFLRVDDAHLAAVAAGEGFDAGCVAVGENDVFAPFDVDAVELPGARKDPDLGLDQQVLGGAGSGPKRSIISWRRSPR